MASAGEEGSHNSNMSSNVQEDIARKGGVVRWVAAGTVPECRHLAHLTFTLPPHPHTSHSPHPHICTHHTHPTLTSTHIMLTVTLHEHGHIPILSPAS